MPGATAASPVEPPASTAVQAVNSHPSFGGESATGGHEEPKYTAAAASAADSLAAMQRFERMAAEREREAAAKRSAQDDDTDAERPPAEFLNETAYDRRKQVLAVAPCRFGLASGKSHIALPTLL